MTMDYSPWVEREIWLFLKVAVSLKPKRPQLPKLVCMHVTSIHTCIKFLGRFRSIKFFDDPWTIIVHGSKGKFLAVFEGKYKGAKSLKPITLCLLYFYTFSTSTCTIYRATVTQGFWLTVPFNT